jgi:hypothetical protein
VPEQLSREARIARRWLNVSGVFLVIGFAALPVIEFVDVPALKVVVVVAGVLFTACFAMVCRWHNRIPDDQ